MDNKRPSIGDFGKAGLSISESDKELLAAEWIFSTNKNNDDKENASMSAVDEALTYATRGNPRICLDIVIKITEKTDDEELLGYLGVSVLEELIAFSADHVIDRVEAEYYNNCSFKKALENVFLSEEDKGHDRVKALIGKFTYA